jgi:hypothetical protein
MLNLCARRSDVLFEEVSGEYIVYDNVNNKVHHLNATMTWIWNSCNGRTALDDMSKAFEHRFGTPMSTDVLTSCLRELDGCGLLERPLNLPDVVLPSLNVSRRSVMTGAILMPAVVSILAPTPAAAKSKPDKDKDKGKGKP